MFDEPPEPPTCRECLEAAEESVATDGGVDATGRVRDEWQGFHWETMEQLRGVAKNMLTAVTIDPLDYENAGRIKTWHADGEPIHVTVPLPFLVHADVETDELAKALSVAGPGRASVEVSIADPP